MHYSAFLTILALTTSTLAYRQPYSNIARDAHGYGDLKPRDAYNLHLYPRDAYAYAEADSYAHAEHDGYGYGQLYARYAEPTLTPEETKRKALEVVHKVAAQNAHADKQTYKIPTQLQQDAHAKLNVPFPAHGSAQEQGNHREGQMRAVQQLAAAHAMLPAGAPPTHNNDWVHTDAQLNRVGVGQA